ncbi:MAG: VIT1/CCC1 transporter family protein [Patescibacteria group bacterium]
MTSDSQNNLTDSAKETKLPDLAKNYIKEIIYGANDGIITTFAVVAGFAGFGSEGQTKLASIAVLVFGLGNLFADGLSMGLGSFLSTRSEKQLYESEKQRHLDNVCDNFETEKNKLIQTLQDKNFETEKAEVLADLITDNHAFWQDFVLQNEQQLNPANGNASLGAITTFLAFLFFGFIPLVPYLFNIRGELAFPISILSSILALILLGILRWKIIGEKLWKGIAEILAVGTVSGLAAFLVGLIFK